MAFIRPITRPLLLAAGMAVLLPASAGTIGGSLRTPGKQPLGDAPVTLTCGGTKSTGRSDPHGNYSLSIAASGLCTLTVGDAKSASVLLGKNPARYDFEVPDAGTSLLQR